MKLVLKNICSINSAEIEFNGITIIAGENNTGKSTVSRALFSSFYGLSRIGERIIEEIINEVANMLKSFGFLTLRIENQEKLLTELIDLKNVKDDLVKENYKISVEDITKIINKYLQIKTDRSDYVDFKNTVIDIAEVLSKDDVDYKKRILNKCIRDEFKERISSVFKKEEESIIELYFNGNNEKNLVRIIDNYVSEVISPTNIIHNILYFDGQDVDYYLQIRDSNENASIMSHRTIMDRLMYFYPLDNIFNNKNEVDKLFEDFDGIGNVYVDKDKTFYAADYFNKPINPIQISQGLKSILILKQLFLNEHIKKKSFIILDEPEINLHPKWQICLAKLLCRLSDEKDIHILLCSHSPYFISAIYEYAMKYNIKDKCSYYLSERSDVTHECSFVNVSKTPKKIFTTLYEPVIELRNINENE